MARLGGPGPLDSRGVPLAVIEGAPREFSFGYPCPPSPPGADTDGRRRLILAGWDRPGPRFIARHAKKMQESPFDGMVLNLWESKSDHRVGNTWTLFHHTQPPRFTESDADFDAFGRVEWTTFTDNFIAARPCPYRTPGIDLFSDDVWRAARDQICFLGRALRASGARGIWLNPEAGLGGMQYSPEHYPGRTFEQVADQARHRGNQFMHLLQSEKPDVRVLFTFLGSVARHAHETGDDPTLAAYGLLPSFASGMRGAADPGAVIVDGAEDDYYHCDSQRYPRSRQYLDNAWYPHQAAIGHDRSAPHQIGSAVFTDLAIGASSPEGWAASNFTFYEDVRDCRDFTTRWLTHNVYNAMLKSDNYVWLWCERMSWWNPAAVGRPNDADAAVRAAREAFKGGAALGYDMCRPGNVGIPAFVSFPSIELSIVSDRTSRPRVGDVLVLGAAVERARNAPEIDHVTFYHNSHVLEETHTQGWRTAVVLTPGAHTFHAVGFNADGTHCSSNPVIITAS